jgi:hypothetical protein
LIARALSQRPDLVAKLANVYAKQNEIRKVRRNISQECVDARRETELDVSIAGSKYFGDQANLRRLPHCQRAVFDGFARRLEMEMAEAELHGAENELAERGIPLCAKFGRPTNFKTALRKQVPRRSWSLRRKTRSTQCSNLTKRA